MPVLILFLVSASSFFGAVFSRLDTPSMVTERLLGLDLSATWILTLAMAFTVLLGLPLK